MFDKRLLRHKAAKILLHIGVPVRHFGCLVPAVDRDTRVAEQRVEITTIREEVSPEILQISNQLACRYADRGPSCNHRLAFLL